MWWSVILMIGFTLLSGAGDALGFIHAGKVWQNDQIVWREVLWSALGFSAGVFMYWLALRYLTGFGIASTEIQTLFWFGITLVGVAVLSGQFVRWHPVDQVVGVAVLAGIGWLLFRAGG